MDSSQMPRKLWQHPLPEGTDMWRYKSRLEQEKNVVLPVGQTRRMLLRPTQENFRK
jgi:hypothetical protein